MNQNIYSISSCDNRYLFHSDVNGRQIYHHTLMDVVPLGTNMIYPNVLLYSYAESKTYNPSEERVMSLDKVKHDTKVRISHTQIQNIVSAPVFYFVYNTDNYFHFLYDSIPYLLSYKHLKKTNKNLKLLMGLPNKKATKPYQFVIECLELLGILTSEIEYISDHTLYNTVHVASSYTYGIDSNKPPPEAVKNLYEEMKTKASSITTENSPRNIYVSRRSWKHGDYSNIGTNYTTRRKMINEDVLIEKLEKLGYKEVFTETMNMREKISLFSAAENVVGPIGGGLVNVLFSSSKTKLISIVSPNFFEVNNRFINSFRNIETRYSTNSKHASDLKYKNYMRVQMPNGTVGEVTNIENDIATVVYSEESVAGWNIQENFLECKVSLADLFCLDNGLNSEWLCDIDQVMELVK